MGSGASCQHHVVGLAVIPLDLQGLHTSNSFPSPVKRKEAEVTARHRDCS